jgi:hypothetical protein
VYICAVLSDVLRGGKGGLLDVVGEVAGEGVCAGFGDGGLGTLRRLGGGEEGSAGRLWREARRLVVGRVGRLEEAAGGLEVRDRLAEAWVVFACS